MKFSVSAFLCALLIGLTACVTHWDFRTSNEQAVRKVWEKSSSIAVSTDANTQKDAQNLRVAIEGELIALEVFRDVVRSCGNADYCLRVSVLGPGEDGYDSIAERFGSVQAPTVVGVDLTDADGRRAMAFDLGGIASVGRRPASGTITIMGTEVARRLAEKIRAAE